MALTTEIAPERPRLFYQVRDRKKMYFILKGADPLKETLPDLDFRFNHDGVMGTAWYREGNTADDLLDVLGALDALAQPITIEADLLRIYWAQTGQGERAGA